MIYVLWMVMWIYKVYMVVGSIKVVIAYGLRDMRSYGLYDLYGLDV